MAGISIKLLLGENGIIQKAKESKEKTLIDQYKGQIELIKLETQMQYTNEMTLENLKEAFDSNDQKYWINHTEIITDEEIEKIKLTTNDGYIFYITTTTVEYKGKDGIIIEPEPPVKITADMISFSPANTDWQVDNVKAALDYLFSH